MRQIGYCQGESEAQRFTAYLITTGVSATAEGDEDTWSIWVRDENDLDQARAEFSKFTADPDNPKYDGVEQKAAEIHREEQRRHAEYRKNFVEFRSRWGRGATRRCPLVFTLIGLSILASLWTSFMQQPDNFNHLAFTSRASLHNANSQLPEWNRRLVNIRQGEIWRLVTPILMHGSPLHLIFNCWMLYFFGGQIEDRKSTVFLGLLVLVIALISNTGQGLMADRPFFGGLSGVVYGLFGYVWMKSLYDPKSGLHITQLTVVILVGWFFACFVGLLGDRIANHAHFFGLATGIVIGYAPELLRQFQSKT